MASADFEPKRKVVTAITNANPGVVTAAAHNYATGDVVRINVPQTYGMDLPPDLFTITVMTANTFSINYDTSLLDAFVVPVLVSFIAAEVLPVSAETDNVA